MTYHEIMLAVNGKQGNRNCASCAFYQKRANGIMQCIRCYLLESYQRWDGDQVACKLWAKRETLCL